MSTQGLEMIDNTVQVTHEWLNELSECIDTPDRRRALRLLRATLHAVRDRLPHEESAHLASQLPVLLRGVYYEGWRPAETPRPDNEFADFMEQVGEVYDTELEHELSDDVSEVFRLLNDRISTGEAAHVRQSLTGELQHIWPL